MTHRERVLASLNHEMPDRCPMQIGFTPEFAERLWKGLTGGQEQATDGSPLSRSLLLPNAYNPHGRGNTYELERAIGEDMLLTSVGWANSYYGPAEAYTDEWGVQWQSFPYTTRFGKGRYTEVVAHPLADDKAIDTYHPPDPHRPDLYRDAEQMIRDFQSEYWIVGVTVTTIFETAWALRGYAQLMMDFALNPRLAERILDIPYHYHLVAAKRLVNLGVDMIWCGDDVGTQKAMLMSPDTWRRFLKPRLGSFVAELKARNPKLKVAYHSDGVITPIIPDLIEIGIDVLNPIQPACMDPAALKTQYGDRLCFWGTLDEQYTLPFGTAEQVRQEVLCRLATVGKGGGLIIGPTHFVQLDTPLENFWAMIETITGTPYKC